MNRRRGPAIEKILRYCGLWHPSTSRAPPPEGGRVHEPDADWDRQSIPSEQSVELTYGDMDEFPATFWFCPLGESARARSVCAEMQCSIGVRSTTRFDIVVKASARLAVTIRNR
ncbi:MAG: hypothetical protein U1E05_20640 [Patescibacteria group bacterium]|nr:hypothetical protein [Patescibacteria group bacterium]